MATTKIKPIEIFVPFTNITRRDEDSAMIVEGYCYVNPRVKGDRFSITRAAMEAATPGYTEFPAVREMHQPIAAGTGLEVTWDDKGCFLRSECVDEGTQRKIDKKVLRGYSIGVNALTVRGDDVESLDWVETSYVDRPKDPDAVFLYRADGFDWDAEVEVEVIEDAPAVAADVPAPDAAAAPDRVQSLPIVAPSSSPLPSGEEAPPSAALQSAQAPAEGVSSSPEEPVDVAVMRAALVRSGTPEEMLDQLDVAASYQALTPEQRAAETLAVLEEASDAEARLDFQRAQTTQTVPIRENLDGMPKPPPEQKPQLAPRPLPVPPAHPAPGTGYPPPATGVPPIPPGMMPKRMRADAPPWVAEMTEQLGVMQERLGQWFAAWQADSERVIKHKDGKWCVYSESGKKLGEHDTEEEAKKQLQAIEIEKHKDEPDATQPKKDRAAEAERYEIVDAPGLFQADKPAFVLLDNQENIVVRWASTREDVEAHLAQLTVPAVEEPPAAPETISRSSERDDVTAALTRAATAEAELARVRSGHEEALTRLAAAEARVQTLERMPLAKPVFRTRPHALDREFLQNLGGEEDAIMKRLEAEYPDAKRAAEEEARVSSGRGGPAYDRWMNIRSQLIQLGASPDTAAPGG